MIVIFDQVTSGGNAVVAIDFCHAGIFIDF